MIFKELRVGNFYGREYERFVVTRGFQHELSKFAFLCGIVYSSVRFNADETAFFGFKFHFTQQLYKYVAFLAGGLTVVCFFFLPVNHFSTRKSRTDH